MTGWRIIFIAAAVVLTVGCSTGVTFVSKEYAERPVQPLDQQAALAEINAFRAKHGLRPVALDPRLTRAAAAQSEDQAGRGRISHYGSDGSNPKIRATRAGYRPRYTAENVASGQKSFSDVMRSWEGSSGHRRNLLLPNVSGAGVAMAQSAKGRPYWTLLLGTE